MSDIKNMLTTWVDNETWVDSKNLTAINNVAVQMADDIEVLSRVAATTHYEVEAIQTSLDNMASDIEELKQGNIEIDLSDYAKKSDLEVKADKSYVDSAIESVDVSSQLTNYATKTELGNKVDKVDGKGLSTNDYTTAEKNKLSGLTNYTHPTSHSATMITEDSTHRFVTDSEKSSWNNKSNLALGTTSTTAFRGDYGNTAYTHSQSAHAPSNAQKNSDITKAEIEAKLTGDVASHTHSQYLINNDELPSYYYENNYITNKINAVKEMMDNIGNDGTVFVAFTDAHMDNGNGGNSAKIIKKVIDECNIPRVFFLGDGGSNSPQTTDKLAISTLENFNTLVKPIGDKLSQILGNHDGAYGLPVNGVTYPYNLPRATVFNRALNKNRLGEVKSFGGDGTYYYIDDFGAKTRFLMLNTSDRPYETNADGTMVEASNTMKGFNIRQDQVDWIIQSLNVQDGWNVCVLSHCPIHDSFMDMASYIRNLFKAYKTKTKYSATYAGKYLWDKLVINADFTTYKGEFVALFSGHAHNDYHYPASDFLIDMISIASDGRISNCSYMTNASYSNRALGTIYEQVVSIFGVNFKNNTVTDIRIGAGADRIISYGTATITTYTVTNNLTNCSSSTGNVTIYEGDSYSTTITANSGYKLDSVTVTMGGTNITSTAYSNGVITISKVTGNVVITGVANAIITNYSVTNNLTNCTSSNSSTTVQGGNSYSATITPANGYEIQTVTVTMGGTNITSTAYSNGVITISKVTGNVVITGVATIVEVPNYITEATPYQLGASWGNTANASFSDGIFKTTLARAAAPAGFSNTELQSLPAGTYVFSGEFKQDQTGTDGTMMIYNGTSRLIKQTLKAGTTWTPFSYEFTFTGTGKIYFCGQNEQAGFGSAYMQKVQIKKKS